MANSRRRPEDREGKMFMPMTIDSGYSDTSFISGKKIAAIAAIILLIAYVAAQMLNGIFTATPIWFKLIVWLGVLFVIQLLVRKVILEENYFYRMYKIMQDNRVTTPAMFWDIVSLRDSPDGCSIMYSDLKVARIVKLERDTIVGRVPDYKEQNFDSISECYKVLNTRGYKYVKLNVMEQAGNDPRLPKLDTLVKRTTFNGNLQKLVGMEVAHVKAITRATLYETDYMLIYSTVAEKDKDMVHDIDEACGKLMDGAFIGYRILNEDEVLQLLKKMYGVRFFDSTQAILSIYQEYSSTVKEPIRILSINYEDGSVKKLREPIVTATGKGTAEQEQEKARIGGIVKKAVARNARLSGNNDATLPDLDAISGFEDEYVFDTDDTSY